MQLRLENATRRRRDAMAWRLNRGLNLDGEPRRRRTRLRYTAALTRLAFASSPATLYQPEETLAADRRRCGAAPRAQSTRRAVRYRVPRREASAEHLSTVASTVLAAAFPGQPLFSARV